MLIRKAPIGRAAPPSPHIHSGSRVGICAVSFSDDSTITVSVRSTPATDLMTLARAAGRRHRCRPSRPSVIKITLDSNPNSLRQIDGEPAELVWPPTPCKQDTSIQRTPVAATPRAITRWAKQRKCVMKKLVLIAAAAAALVARSCSRQRALDHQARLLRRVESRWRFPSPLARWVRWRVRHRRHRQRLWSQRLLLRASQRADPQHRHRQQA